MSTENPEGAPAGQAAGEPGPVPYSRFAQVNAKVGELQAAAETAKAEAAAAKAAAAEIETRYKSEAASWLDERSIMQRGITDAEGIAVTKTLFGLIPAEARPADGIAGWLGSMTPETAPIPLRPYLAGPKVAAAPPPANAGATQRVAEAPGTVTKATYDAELAKARAGGHAALLAFRESPIFKAYTGQT